MKAISDTSKVHPRNCCGQCGKAGFSPAKSKKMGSHVAPLVQVSSHSISCIAFRTTTRWVIERSGIGYTRLSVRKLTAPRRPYCSCRHTRRCFSWVRNGAVHHHSITSPTMNHNSGTTSRKEEEKSSNNSPRFTIPRTDGKFLIRKQTRRFSNQG